MAKENIEAWLDVGAMREEVTEHARLMATMNMIMNEAKRTVHFTSTATMRDIGDAAVLRRVRMIQLAAMVNMDKVKLVFARHGKAYREKAMGKDDRKDDRKRVQFGADIVDTTSNKDAWGNPYLTEKQGEEETD